MYFSKENGFIPDEWIKDGSYKTLPEDAVRLTDAEVSLFHKVPAPVGKMLGTVGGRLSWVNIPEPTQQELITEAEQTKERLRTTAESEITWRQYAVGKGIATSAEEAELEAWNMYRVKLMRTRLTDAPEIDWPDIPQAVTDVV